MPGINAFTEGPPPREDYRIAGPITGRIKRRPGVGKAEARKLAKQYDWYRPALKYDGRCKRWHVFREP